MGQVKRTSQIIPTAKGAVLKEFRKSQGLSVRMAGYFLEKSDSYISHIETGRCRT